ncbi:unnamed protein product, partial [Porites evermanni]
NSILVASHVIIALLSPVAIVGNAEVLTAIWKKSFQRTPFHILLSVLAFSDLCTGVATSVMSIPYLCNHKLYTTESAIGNLSGTYLVSLTVLVITLMSIERWLHMTRQSSITSRGGCLIAAVSLVVPIPFVVLQGIYFYKDSFKLEVGTTMGVYLLSCYLATTVAYFKVFRIIRRHQQQIRGNQSCQSVGKRAIDLAKYKKSVISILYILVLFSFSFMPVTVILFLLVKWGKSKGTWEPYYESLVFLFLSSSLNPGLYTWRMRDIRDGVKSLFRPCRSHVGEPSCAIMFNITTWPSPFSIPSTMSTGASAKETNSILVVSHVIIVLFSPMAVVGNAVVLMAIWKNSFLRTSFHILLSVLAFTDLCTGMATLLMSIPYLLLHTFETVSQIGIFIEAYLVSLTILVITLMSVGRWLHMTHRSLLTSRRGYLTAVISLLVPIPLVTLQVFNFIEERLVLEANAISGVYTLSCYLATSVAYFKVFRIIRQHQQQIHGNQSRQNFGRPAIDLAKYKKSIFSILYILALFSLCILPFIVSLFLLVLLGEKSGMWAPYHVSLVFLFSASCLNPGLYIWRMKDVRDGVKKLCCCTNGLHQI